MTNWKTTSAGILAIIAAVTGLVFAIKNNSVTADVIMACATGVLGGVGLLLAKDQDVTGGTKLNAKNDAYIVKQSAAHNKGI